MARLSGRRIAITGAGSGIGLATAELFLREGASVLAIDCAPNLAETVRDRLKAASPAIVACALADVSVPEQVNRAFVEGERQLGGIDGVVNSAGLDLMRPFADMTPEDWNRVIAVNLTGPALVCMAALPAFKRAGRGTIVNIASGAGLRPLDRRSAY